ncbi:hypothetical protein [Hyphococcus sp.]|uniref:hypothetical protein n=1 Tax=Hyphococcus sp. TaxID=2038636 RepID=UPI003CCBED9D
MAIFFGYDPGGQGNHGVAIADIASDGTFSSEPELYLERNTGEVVRKFSQINSVAAVGVDTLLAWSLNGGRICDNVLRAKYSTKSASIISQNSLYSSMTINGVMFALAVQETQTPLYETHPKLILHIIDQVDEQCAELKERVFGLRGSATSKSRLKNADDMGDALVAAWCASRGWYGKWPRDLFVVCGEDLIFPAGRASYPWPEDL